MNKNRTEGTESSTTRSVESKVRGFFERAADRMKNAVRNVQRRRDPRDREEGLLGRNASRRCESNLPPGYGYEPQRWREGSVHDPMLEWREDRGYEGRGYEGRGSGYERDEEYGGYGGSQYMGRSGRDEDYRRGRG